MAVCEIKNPIPIEKDIEKKIMDRLFNGFNNWNGGYAVSSQAGTYEFNEDATIITFAFPAGEEGSSSNLPGGMTSLGGAFSFKQENDCIWIGTVCYQKDTVGTESDETEHLNEESSRV